MREMIAGTIISVVHFILQFIGWSAADAINMRTTLLWNLLSFPTFYIIPGSILNKYFWAVCVVNSVLWGLMALIIVKKLKR